MINKSIAHQVKFIPNFTELLNVVKFLSLGKCFLIEDGNDENIERWIENEEITCGIEILF